MCGCGVCVVVWWCGVCVCGGVWGIFSIFHYSIFILSISIQIHMAYIALILFLYNDNNLNV